MEKSPFTFTYKEKQYQAEFSIQEVEDSLHCWVWFQAGGSPDQEFVIIQTGQDPYYLNKCEEIVDELEGELIPRIDEALVQVMGEAIERMQD